MNRATIGVLYGLGAFVFFAGMMNLTMHGWLAWYRLFKHGHETAGTITAVDAANHSSCTFKYVVASQEFQGSDQGCHFAVGEVVSITYSPDRPSFATTVSPGEELAVQVIGAVGMSIFAGLVASFRASTQRGNRGRDLGLR